MKQISSILFLTAVFSTSAFGLSEKKREVLAEVPYIAICQGGEDSSSVQTTSLGHNTTIGSLKKTSNSRLFFNTLKGKTGIQSDSLDPQWYFYDNPKGTLIDRVKFSGHIRFLTIYRNMRESYPDMITADKNFSFTDYPIANAGVSNNGSQPMLELTMELPVSNNVSFTLGYSYATNFGSLDSNGRSTNYPSSRSNMFVAGSVKTDNFAISVDAGQILWARMSRFTMGQAIYRDNYFDRVPWDGYRRSFQRYNDYYSYSNNIGPEGFGRSPIQGVVINADFKKAKTGVLAVFGRTNRNLIQANATNHYPSLTYGLRVHRGFITDLFTTTVGVNAYMRDADTDPIHGIQDNVKFGSVDFEAQRREMKLSGEIGMGQIQTPDAFDGGQGLALDFKAEVFDNLLPFTLSAEYYDIDINAGTLDGSIINSNKALKDGGYGNELNWDNMLYLNVAQEVDQIANNRRGLILKAKKTLGRFKIDIGYALSQEKKNYYDTVTVQHRVNAFSRSRFRPWYQAGGPYSRVKSNWMRTYETITIHDEANGISTDYNKGFNSIELLLKYKAYLFSRELILLSLNNFNSIQDHFSVLPTGLDKAFVNTIYSDFTVAYAMGKNYMLVGNAGVENVKGSYRTDLSPENGKPINQNGLGFGLGIDYDFHKQANLHLRHRWMYNSDENFVLDKFRGQETYFELKVLF